MLVKLRPRLSQARKRGLDNWLKQYHVSLPSRISHKATLAAHIHFKGVAGNHQPFKKKHAAETSRTVSQRCLGNTIESHSRKCRLGKRATSTLENTWSPAGSKLAVPYSWF